MVRVMVRVGVRVRVRIVQHAAHVHLVEVTAEVLVPGTAARPRASQR